MTTDPGFSIGAVSELTGLSVHALRFYEREGLFLGRVGRDSAGRRRFSQAQVDWLLLGVKLRAAGMPLPEIRRFAEAARDEATAATVQLELLREHEQRVRAQLAELEQVLATMTAKVARYSARRSRNS